MDQEQDQRHLQKADQDIAECRDRIKRQRVLINRVAALGKDTELARSILRTLQGTLRVMEDHRRTIRDRLGM
jgi:hypothetical protein